MISIYFIAFIIMAHFVGDFILQTDAHATGKSKDNVILLSHVLMYSLPFVILAFVLSISLWWVIINAALHFCVDYVSSRMTSKLWQEGDKHNFFVVIGADQATHLICLFATLLLFV